MEEKIDVVICEKYGLFFVMSTLVKYVDFIMLVIECCDFGFDDGFFWFVLEGILVIEMFNVILLVLGYVYGMFMECFNDLLELCKCVWMFLKWKGFFVGNVYCEIWKWMK